MQLTQYTDYGLRTLLALALNPGEWQTVTVVSRAYGISRHHLVKVAARLAECGYVETQRGRGGGMRLARPPSKIVLGAVVRDMEAELGVVECLEQGGGRCVITPACGLKGVLAEATGRFLEVLDRYNLDDLKQQRAPVARLLGIPLIAESRA
ncbi:MAG TPA: Rrf2 family transcriptional regulator [Steroidobacteraceae bacterium]|nr:Rrf2 family transcriptional regulator [Steroidobacteraceae bacterium]